MGIFFTDIRLINIRRKDNEIQNNNINIDENEAGRPKDYSLDSI